MSKIYDWLAEWVDVKMVIDHDEGDNLSDKETFSKNTPAIGESILS